MDHYLRIRPSRTLTLVICMTLGCAAAVAAASAQRWEVSAAMDGAENSKRVARLTVSSSAFRAGGTVPARFTCDGANLSPPLRWSRAPRGTREIALVLDDPDAPGGTFVHWVVFRLKANLRALAAGRLPSGARQGRNDFGSPRYGGPCPPAGDRPHRYRFTVYALSKRLGLGAGSPHRTVRSRINRSTIGRGRLVGQYAR